MSEVDNVQAPVFNQGTESNKTVDATLPQHQPDSNSAAGHQEAEDGIDEGATKLPSQDVRGTVTTVTSVTNSQSEGLAVDPDTNANQNGQAEIGSVEQSGSPSQTQTDVPQNILPTLAVDLGSCTSASNGEKENSLCDLEGDEETNNKRCNDTALADVTPVINEEEAESPPKKKQRVERAAEQSGTEVQPQPTNGPEDSRKEAPSAEINSDETSVLCGPGGFKSCEDQENPPSARSPVACSEQQQTMNLTDTADLQFLDYVSDSQLNTIALTEDLMMEADLHSPECPDVTDLMRGLIQELSSLNQKVMAAHRDLENLHRSSKGLRNSLR
eukprot:XP_011610762.1 PREDICTED: uncharacterized protein LOC105417633 [Takifugu rubripes]